MFCLKFIKAHLFTERAVQVQLYAGAVFEHPVDIALYERAGEPEDRDTVGHHAAEAVGLFIDVNFITRFSQVLSGSEPRRAAAHDADGLATAYRNRWQMRVVFHPIGDESLQVADGHGPVALAAPALRFTGHGAHSAADGAEWIIRPDHIEGFLEPALSDKPYIGGNVRSNWTPSLAGRRSVIRIVVLVVMFLRYKILSVWV